MSTLIRRLILRQSQLGVFHLGFISLAAALALSTSALASPTESPERETYRIARSLKPISDDAWKEVAGEQITGKYDITRGDTLYDISKRLFGDARYWPKIWALNNGSILNPHLIRPGNRIAFMPGTGTSLPTVSIESPDPAVNPSLGGGRSASSQTLTDADMSGLPPLPKIAPRSQEWKMLPSQAWEATEIEANEAAKNEVTVMGSLDKVHTLTPTRELSLFAASQPVPFLGEIVSSPTITTYMKVGDQVLIRGMSEDIKPGETYALTHTPEALEKNEKKRQGLAYHVDGEVQIVGIQNNLWIGLIKQGRGLIQRGGKLIPLPPRIKNMDLVPAPAAQEGQFYVDKGAATFIAGQHSFGFVNLGSEDGLQEGMVLESFQSQDLNTGRSLAYPELFHVADMQVVQVSEHFSTVLIFSGASELYDGLPVRLVTDLSTLQKYGAAPGGNMPLAPDATPADGAPADIPPPPAPAPTETPPAPEPAQPVQPVNDAAAASEKDIPPPITAPPVIPPVAPPVVPPVPTPEPAPTATPTPAEALQAPPPPAPAPEAPPAPAATPTPAPTKNELDALDGEEQLDPNEQRELQQLENYKAKTPDAAQAAPTTPAPPAPVAPETAPAESTVDSDGTQVF
jgi:hypothetical protein